MRLSPRFDLKPGIFSQLAQAKQALLDKGRRVIDLGVGTPDRPPADHLVRALSSACADASNYKYAVCDLPELRAAVVAWYQRRFGVTLDAATQIHSLYGSQEGLAHAALAMLAPGDAVLCPDPGYPIFSMGPYVGSCEVIRVPQSRENGYLMDFDAVSEADARRAKMIIASYPNNPVTVVAPDSFYQKLIAFAKRYDLMVIHDNAYCELTFDGRVAGSFLAHEGAMEVGIELNSLSKTYNLSGARIGFALGNADMVARLATLKSHIDYGIFVPLQRLAIAALEGEQDEVYATRDAYARRRDLFLGALSKSGWVIEPPQATMFVWARLPGKHTDAAAFCLEMLERSGVVIVPGDAFGPMGAGHVRMALVQSEETLLKAAQMMAASGMWA